MTPASAPFPRYARAKRRPGSDPVALRIAELPELARQRLASRLWARVRKGAPDACWLWTGPKRGRMGYGAVTVRGRSRVAHRVAYELERGPIPAGAFVLHRCDRPCCVNPRHLMTGDAADNARQAAQRGRFNAKLTPAALREIFAARESSAPPTLAELGERFGVTASTIGSAARGVTWRHVAEAEAEARRIPAPAWMART